MSRIMGLGMFGDSKVILYVTKARILVGDYVAAKPKVAQITWDGINAVKSFTAIKAAISGTNVRVVLGNDISYVICFEMETDRPERADVFEAARTAIPEEISEDSFDWKIVGKQPESGKFLVQATAISATIFTALSLAAKESGITIEAMSPVSVVLAAMTQYLPSPHMVLWSQTENLAVVAAKGIVYLTSDITGDTIGAVKQACTFTEERFGFRIAHFYIDWRQDFEAGIDMPAFANAVLTGGDGARYTMDPMKFVALKAAESGKDEDILAIRPTGKPILAAESQEQAKPIASRTSDIVDYSRVDVSAARTLPFGKRLGIVLANLKVLLGLSVVLLAALGVFSYRYSRRNAQPIRTAAITPTQAPTLTPAAPTPTITLSGLRIQVLNGSGTEGEAGRAAALLTPAGFTAVTTGNADAFTYTDTEVRLKGAVRQDIYGVLEQSLSTYSVTRSADLAGDAAFDVSVIVGSKKKISKGVRFA